MQDDYDERLLGSGAICSIVILSQDGPICKEIYEVTLNLLKLAEQCWSPKSMVVLQNKLPPGKKTRGMMGAMVGTALHDCLYDLAVASRRCGQLPSNLKITRPVTRMKGSADMKKGSDLTKGPDFILNGKIGTSDVVAAWDFTTQNALASHYDRDVLGKSRQLKPVPDIGIQEVVDRTNYWSSYIAICY